MVEEQKEGNSPMISLKTGTRTGPSAIVHCVQSRGRGRGKMQVQLRKTGMRVFSFVPSLIHLSLFLLPWKLLTQLHSTSDRAGDVSQLWDFFLQTVRARLSGCHFLSPCPPCQLYLSLYGIKSQSSGHLEDDHKHFQLL